MFGLFNKPKMNVRTEIDRRTSHRNRILANFRQHKVLYTGDLATVTPRYSARIGELRNLGHKIDCGFVRSGCFKYTYKGYKPNLRVA